MDECSRRRCNWPVCLTEEQARRLTQELVYEEETGLPHPNPDLTDYRLIHNCVEIRDEEPPW